MAFPGHIVLKGGYFDNIDLAVWIFLDGYDMFIANEALPIERIFNRLPLNKKCL